MEYKISIYSFSFSPFSPFKWPYGFDLSKEKSKIGSVSHSLNGRAEFKKKNPPNKKRVSSDLIPDESVSWVTSLGKK